MTKHFYYYFENSIEIKLMYLLKKLMHHDNLALDTHLPVPVFNSSEEKSDVEFLIDNEDFISSIENEIQKYSYQLRKWIIRRMELIIREDLAVSKAVKSTLNEYSRKMKVYEKNKVILHI